jgi:hypothetical protein
MVLTPTEVRLQSLHWTKKMRDSRLRTRSTPPSAAPLCVLNSGKPALAKRCADQLLELAPTHARDGGRTIGLRIA